MRLHLSFRRIHRGVVDATDQLFSLGAWPSEERLVSGEDVIRHYEQWLSVASRCYHIAPPTIEINERALGRALDSAEYELGQITLAGFSAVNLFRMFRHHMQALGCVPQDSLTRYQEFASPEMQDAVAWACSLFYTTRPTLFRKYVRNGSIQFVRPEDLLANAGTRLDNVPGDGGTNLMHNPGFENGTWGDGAHDFSEGPVDDETYDADAPEPTTDVEIVYDTTSVMIFTGRSRSYVCAHATELGGRQVGRTWEFPKQALLDAGVNIDG